MARKILIVEDNPVIASIWGKNVSNAGYEAKVAESGQKARELVESWSPDAVLLDVFLPETDGLTLCREWKQSPETAQMKIVFVSAFRSRRDIEAAVEAGADGYLGKSASTASELAGTLEKTLTA